MKALNDSNSCEKFRISIRISVKFVPKGPIDNKAAVVQVMAWRRTGDKPLHEAMLSRRIYAVLGGDELSILILEVYICV